MAVARRFLPGVSRRAVVLAGALGAAGLAAVAGRSFASDHDDTPFVEGNKRFDVNDVYAFPAATPGRVVLILGTQSPITPANAPTAAFGTENEVLYQLKVDNTGDAREDLVFQVTFTGTAPNQTVRVRGPVAPNQVGTANTLATTGPVVEGATNTILGSASGMQVFAGPRDDPFFIDLEQFFRILPDRRPEAGPLSMITQGPLTFRPAAPQTGPNGSAVDFLRSFNDLAIVIELPLADLTANGTRPKFGVWGTTSRSRTR